MLPNRSCVLKDNVEFWMPQSMIIWHRCGATCGEAYSQTCTFSQYVTHHRSEFGAHKKNIPSCYLSSFPFQIVWH